jgi:hypothetical protein
MIVATLYLKQEKRWSVEDKTKKAIYYSQAQKDAMWEYCGINLHFWRR